MQTYKFTFRSTSFRPLTKEKNFLDAEVTITAKSEAEAWQIIQSFCSDPNIISDHFLPFDISYVDKMDESDIM